MHDWVPDLQATRQLCVFGFSSSAIENLLRHAAGPVTATKLAAVLNLEEKSGVVTTLLSLVEVLRYYEDYCT